MVVGKEKIFEWELKVSDNVERSISEEEIKFLDSRNEIHEVELSLLRKFSDIFKSKDNLAYAIIITTIIVISLIAVISLFFMISGLLLKPYLTLSLMGVIMVSTMCSIFKLVKRETRCKQ